MKAIEQQVHFEGELIDLVQLDTHMRTHPKYTGWVNELDKQIRVVFVVDDNEDPTEIANTVIAKKNEFVANVRATRIANNEDLPDPTNGLEIRIKKPLT